MRENIITILPVLVKVSGLSTSIHESWCMLINARLIEEVHTCYFKEYYFTLFRWAKYYSNPGDLVDEFCHAIGKMEFGAGVC